MTTQSKTTLLPVLSGGKDSVAFSVNPLFGRHVTDAIAHVETDLLVLTDMFATTDSGLMKTINRVYDDVLARKMAEVEFTGQLGEFVLIDMAEEGFSEAPMKKILLVGLGRFDSYNPRTSCGFFQSAVEKAIELGVEKVSFTLPSKRLTDKSYSIAFTMALLRCRLEQFAKDEAVGNLREVELICSPQASRFVRQGLNTCGQRCSVCRDLGICHFGGESETEDTD